MKRLLFILVIIGCLVALLVWKFSSEPSLEAQPASLVFLPAPEVVKPEPATVTVKAPVAPERPYSPPVVRDARLRALVNRDAHDRIPSDISARLSEVSPEDFPALLQVLTDPKDDDTVRNEVANLLVRSKCPDLPQTFIKVLDNPDEHARFRFYAMQFMGNYVAAPDSDDSVRLLLLAKIKSSLSDKDFEIRSQALQHLVNLNNPVGQQTAVKWLTDYPLAPTQEAAPQADPADKNTKPIESLRGPDFQRGTIIKQCIECVAKLGLKEHIPTIRKYVSDPNASIAEAAIIALTNWGDTESLPAMIEAAKSKDPLLRHCAKDNIDRMQQKKTGP